LGLKGSPTLELATTVFTMKENLSTAGKTSQPLLLRNFNRIEAFVYGALGEGSMALLTLL
jgi:hypothetical protein